GLRPGSSWLLVQSCRLPFPENGVWQLRWWRQMESSAAVVSVRAVYPTQDGGADAGVRLHVPPRPTFHQPEEFATTRGTIQCPHRVWTWQTLRVPTTAQG